MCVRPSVCPPRPGPIRAGGKLIETASMKEIFPIAHVAEVPVFGQRSKVQGQADPLNFRIGDHGYCCTGSELNDTMHSLGGGA